MTEAPIDASPASTPESGPPAHLARTAARGGAVTVGGQVVRIGVQVASVVVLSRLLSPSDYGVVAMVVAVIGVGELLRDFVLSSAAIQAKTLSRGQQSNLWWINTGLGAALALATAAFAPLIAHVYDEPEIVDVARVLGLTFLLNGFAGQYRADLVRAMRFSRLALLDVVAPVVGFALALVLALNGAGYWALVAQQLAQAAVLALALCVSAGWWPSMPDRHAPVGSMLRFGGNLVATQVVGYVANNADSFVIGRQYGAADLGVYNRGYQLVTTTLSQLRVPTTTVALPVLSRIQEDRVRFGAYVQRGQVVLGYTLVAGVALLAGTAEPVVHLALGPTWSEVTPVVRLLAIAGGMQTLAYVGYWVYLSRALTGDLLRYSSVMAVVKIAAIVVGSQWGYVGVAAGIAVAASVEWPVSLWWLSRRTELPTAALLLAAVRIVVVAAAGALAAAAVVAMGDGALWTLPLAAIAWAAAYALAAMLVPRVRRDLVDVVSVVRAVAHRRSVAA
jgi:O-antigen/teichoic acid export membrane protein